MDILNKFEALERQTVGAFHDLLGRKIFTEFNDEDEIEVGKVSLGDRSFTIKDKTVWIPSTSLKTKRVDTVSKRNFTTLSSATDKPTVKSVPVELVTSDDFNLPSADFKVYMYLKLNKTIVGYGPISRVTGISLKTLNKIIKSLENKGLIKTELKLNNKYIRFVEKEN